MPAILTECRFRTGILPCHRRTCLSLTIDRQTDCNIIKDVGRNLACKLLFCSGVWNSIHPGDGLSYRGEDQLQ
jgi:hypothetical protein